MADLSGRIAEVLREHQWSIITDRCRCEDPATRGEWPAHAAEAVVAAVRAGLVDPLRERFKDGEAALLVLASGKSYAPERARVTGKAQGLNLALSYLDEQLRVGVLGEEQER